MHLIFLEAKQKIKQLKEESKYVLRNRSPLNLIESSRQSRNNQRGLYSQSVENSERRDSNNPISNTQLFQTVTNLTGRPSSPFSNTIETRKPAHAPLPTSGQSQNKYFDRVEYDRQISQRRKEKISTLKSQLQTMLTPTQNNQQPSYLTTEAGFYSRTADQLTPDKRTKLSTEAKKYSHLENNMMLQQSSGSKYQNTGDSKHSALKSRPAIAPSVPLKSESNTVFKLVQTGSANSFGFQPYQPSPSPNPKITYSSLNSESKNLTTQHIKLNEVALSSLEGQNNVNCNQIRNMQTESKFSIYTYSDTDEASIIQQHINHLEMAAQAQIVNKIESQMEGEPSITFISSKFIKSNSVESIPELQVVQSVGRPESVSQKKDSLDLNSCVKVMNQQLNAPGSPESVGQLSGPGQLFTCITNTVGKKRTQSSTAQVVPEIMNILDYSSNRSSQQQSSSNRAAYIQIQNQEEKPKPSRQPSQVSPIRPISPSGVAKITEIFRKEDLQRAQIALLQLNDDQIRKMPVLYVNELRRLARTISRIFGEHIVQGNVI